MNRSQTQPIEPLTYRMADLPIVFNVSRRTIERARSAGRFPQPNLHLGKAPLWTRKAVENWIEQGGGKAK